MRRTTLTCLLLALALSLPATAMAQDADAPADGEAPTEAPAEAEAPSDEGQPEATLTVEPTPPREELMLSLAPHVGVLVPQLFSDLGSFPVFGLELGYILPINPGGLVQPLSIEFDVMFTAPGAEGDGTSADLGLEGADYQWELTQQMLILELTATWRFMPPGEGLVAYAQLGPRLYLMESILEAEGNGGQDFGQNRETNREVGFVLAGGVEYTLGPGALFGALEFTFSDLKQEITGDASTGALVLDLGYRLFF